MMRSITSSSGVLAVAVITAVLCYVPCHAIGGWEDGPGEALGFATTTGLDGAGEGFLTHGGLTTIVNFGAAALAARGVDRDDRIVRWLDNSPLDGWMDPGDTYGDARILGAGAAGLLLTGKLIGSPRLSEAGRDLTQSLLLAAGSVWVIKLAVDADRPSGGDFSFPSGHTAAAFSAAPVLAHHFGPRVGAFAYLLAASTGLGRMEDRHHHLSDVLFGAGIGLVAGHEVLAGSRFGSLLGKLSLTPNSAGLVVRY